MEMGYRPRRVLRPLSEPGRTSVTAPAAGLPPPSWCQIEDTPWCGSGGGTRPPAGSTPGRRPLSCLTSYWVIEHQCSVLHEYPLCCSYAYLTPGSSGGHLHPRLT
jgi:hypothetical protein